jgi:hypothetical protein
MAGLQKVSAFFDDLADIGRVLRQRLAACLRADAVVDAALRISTARRVEQREEPAGHAALDDDRKRARLRSAVSV